MPRIYVALSIELRDKRCLPTGSSRLTGNNFVVESNDTEPLSRAVYKTAEFTSLVDRF